MAYYEVRTKVNSTKNIRGVKIHTSSYTKYAGTITTPYRKIHMSTIPDIIVDRPPLLLVHIDDAPVL